MEIVSMPKVSRFSILLTNGKVDNRKPWQIQTVGYSFVTHVGRVIRKSSDILMMLYKEEIRGGNTERSRTNRQVG